MLVLGYQNPYGSSNPYQQQQQQPGFGQNPYQPTNPYGPPQGRSNRISLPIERETISF